MNIGKFWEENEDEYLKSEKIKNPLHKFRDLNGMLLLANLVEKYNVGNDYGILSCAEHDVVYFDVDCEKLEEFLTDEEALDLILSGILFDDNGFYMNV